MSVKQELHVHFLIILLNHSYQHQALSGLAHNPFYYQTCHNYLRREGVRDFNNFHHFKLSQLGLGGRLCKPIWTLSPNIQGFFLIAPLTKHFERILKSKMSAPKNLKLILFNLKFLFWSHKTLQNLASGLKLKFHFVRY